MTETKDAPELVLASASPYRRRQLAQLGVRFSTVSADIDESALAGETAPGLARRLAREKAACIGKIHPDAWIVGSDQVAELDGRMLGKPGNEQANIKQLLEAAGKDVAFFTGLCLSRPSERFEALDVVRYDVRFRSLTTEQIRAYVKREHAFDCAGGFKVEGLGIALFESMRGDDPNALIGLPLIRLVTMLWTAGYDVLSQMRVERGT